LVTRLPADCRAVQPRYEFRAHNSYCKINEFIGIKQDVQALVNYIHDEKNGINWDLDYLVPLAAITENRREIDSIDSKLEIAHRIMLTNLLRLLGMVKTGKASCGVEALPAQGILPLSPNHCNFGNDALYSESKLALEALLRR